MLLGEPTHIDHYLSSLSEHLPAELAAEYDTPRKAVEDEHATIHGGTGFPTLQAVQDAAEAAERMVAAAGRKLGLQQHWIDFAGRKTSTKDKKGLVASIEMAAASSIPRGAASMCVVVDVVVVDDRDSRVQRPSPSAAPAVPVPSSSPPRSLSSSKFRHTSLPMQGNCFRVRRWSERKRKEEAMAAPGSISAASFARLRLSFNGLLA